ncbi:MAG: ribonuclease P protein component [Cyanobacteria bacterium]|nr:ribonuclease P protein component [Cyanobacteriota bacterium]
MGLPKANRLKQRQDFDRVYQSGKRRRATGLHLVVLRNSLVVGSSEVLPIQVGISISKKVSKRAVVRNRIKRQLKAIVRPLLPRLESGLRMVILVRSEALTYEYGEFLQELEQLLVKAEVLNGDQ